MASAARPYPFTRALVTGASSGIGAEFVRLLSTAGVACVVVARREDRLNDLAAQFPGTEVLVADLGTEAGVARVAERIASQTDPVDLVINNAGFGTSGKFSSLDPDRLAGEIALNITAVTRLSHAALATMVPKRRGWLINVSSVASFQASPYLSVYAATKAFVTNLTESLQAEVAGNGVNVTALCPGLTRTEFQEVSNTEEFITAFPSFAWTGAEMVAAAGLKAVVAGKTIEVPGALYKALVGTSSVTPRWLSRRISLGVQSFRRR
jgi:short-subunit dehydrogenase